MTWPIHQEANRCTFWTSCTGVSWKRHWLCIMSSFGYSCLTHMQILVGRVLHTGTESTLRMSYLGSFWFSFHQVYMVNKRRHYCAGGITLLMFHGHYSSGDWVVIILDNLNFCVSVVCIIHGFELFFVCFAFLICIHTEVECCMT